jgi:hypothetical protein
MRVFRPFVAAILVLVGALAVLIWLALLWPLIESF